MKLRTIFTLLLVLTVLVVPVALASNGIPEDPTPLQLFLAALLTGSGVGVAVSWIFEKVPGLDEWFASLTKKYKRLAVMVTCLILPSVAAGIMVGLEYLTYDENLVFLALLAAFDAYTSSQLWHIKYMKSI